MHIHILERIIELFLEGRFRILYIRDIHIPVRRKSEACSLGKDLERSPGLRHETVSDTGIICTEHKVKSLEFQCQLVVILLDLRFFLKMSRQDIIHCLFFSLSEPDGTII